MSTEEKGKYTDRAKIAEQAERYEDMAKVGISAVVVLAQVM